MNIYKIVFTGGPCAGKTTVIEAVKGKLINDGYFVVTIPETASELIKNGILPNSDRLHTLKFQELILKTQIRKERIVREYCETLRNSAVNLIENKKDIVILCDRGVMDNRAYLSHEEYNNMLEKHGYDEYELLNQYDLVINLISTASIKPELYRLDGVRYESVDEAAYKDEITSAAWLLHKHLKMIKPTDNINEKIAIVLDYIYSLLQNKLKQETISFEVDEDKSDFTCYNDNNSRKTKTTRYYLRTVGNDYVVVEETKYNRCYSFVMEDYEITYDGLSLIERRSIGYSEYSNLRSMSFLMRVEEIDNLYFVHQGEHFVLIKDNSTMKLHTTSKEVLKIPENIVLKKEKNLYKIK